MARDDGEIVIKSANPQVIYVPYYEPERVVVYQTVPVYHYYPRRYPVYYYPYPAHYAFDTGFFWGVRSWFSVGWHSHHVHVYDPFFHSHPYYGWSYYDPWYTRNVFVNINVNRNRDYIWEPRNRYGGRPVVRGNEGRVYTGNTPARSADTAARVGGGMAGGAYRSRSVESTTQARQAAEARQPRRGVLADGNRGTTVAPSAESNVSRGTAGVPRAESNVYRGGSAQPDGSAPSTRERIYRSGGGMSQAQRERPQVETRQSAPAPRALERSTGMPRESARVEAPRAAPQVSRESSGGGMSQAQRGGGGGDGGGSYRSSGGESSRGGGGREHPAARGSEGRSAGR